MFKWRSERKLRYFKWLRLGAIASVVFLFLGLIIFFLAVAWVSRYLPRPGEIVRHEGFATRVLDRNGKVIHELFQDERRDPVSLDKVPEFLRQATIATEDKDFYQHQGFDIMTILRIPYNVVFRQRVVGGSTLTQQLVKNVLLTNERTVIRKFKELILALQIERKFSKDQILEMYLNEAPYGGTAWGVGTAAQMYFNKDVSELTLAESVVLAGLPQRPSAYSPFAGRTDDNGELLWKIRAKGVLRRMMEDNYISSITYEEAVAGLENLQFQTANSGLQAPHFVFYIQDKLEEIFGEDVLSRGGLTVTTTLDLELQNAAQEIVAKELDKLEKLNITNGAAMAVKPQTGEILAMVGSRDYFSDKIDGQFNVAVDGLRQPGSSIKPVTYLAMFKKGYSPSSMIADVETVFTPNEEAEKPYQPKNYDGQFRGPVSLRNALGSSLNVPAVKSVAMVGVENFLSLAYQLGFKTLEPSEANLRRFGLAVTLGGAEVHLIDTVSAYSTFANGGYRIEPVALLKVTDKNGSTLYEYKDAKKPQVLTAEEVFLINNVLSDNNARLLAFGANSLLNLSPNVAVKTGTTNDQRDNWTIGWSQDVIVGTWVGNNDNSPMKQVASGVTGASPIWRQIMQQAFKQKYQAAPFVKPDGIEEKEVDKISGYPAHDNFESRVDYFIKGTAPQIADPIHSKLKVCRDDQRKLATDAKIANGDFAEKEFVALREEDPVSQDGRNRWQEGIDAWVAAQTGDFFKPPTEYCGDTSEVAVRMIRPENEKTYDSEEIDIKIEADSGEGIEKIELWVDGKLRETINNRQYEGKIKLDKGRHELYAKALSKAGKWAESSKVKVGTGGASWKEEPSPSPYESPTL